MRKVVAALLLALSAFPAVAQTCPPVPALPDTERVTIYTLTAQTGPFAVGFQLYGDSTDYANWLEVTVDGVLQTSADYTITSASGPLSTTCRPITDAQITFTVATTGTVRIVGDRRPRRASQFTENRGVSARDLNRVLTDIIATQREDWDRLGRTIQVPGGDTIATLPPAASRANHFLGFDGSGALTLLTGTEGSISGDYQGAGAQSLSISPTGNSTITLSSISVQATTVSNIEREFVANFGLVNNITTGAPQEKVALYAGIISQPSTAITQTQWSLKTVNTLATGTGTAYSGIGYELEFNNLQGHRGEAVGMSGFVQPIAYGLEISGTSAFRSTAAVLILGNCTNVTNCGSGLQPQWNRGVVIANNSVKQAAFQDLGHSDISIDIQGVHSYGIDMGNAAGLTGAAIRIPNTAAIAALATNQTNINLILLDNFDIVRLGGGTIVNVTSPTVATTSTDGALRVDGGVSAGDAGVFGRYVQTGAVAFASLPACGSLRKGARYFITDSNSTTFMATAAAGGGNNVPVICDGTVWKVG